MQLAFEHSIRFAFTTIVGIALVGVGYVTVARADLSASYDGQLALTTPSENAAVTGTLSQSGNMVNGTITLALAEPSLSGDFSVRGVSNGRRFRLSGWNGARARLVWSGTVTADGLTGRLRLWAPSARRRGTMTFTAHPIGSSGAGADLFAQNCSPCHGNDAHGQYGPDIHCNKSIHDTVRNGRTGQIGTMPAFTNLSDADIAAIQDFLMSLCQAPTGLELFTSNCAPCHGADAAGGSGRPNIQCTVRSRIFNAVRTGRGNGLMPIFPSSALPDAAVDEIVGYVGTLCSGLPGDRFASNCVTCHGATAGGSRNANGVAGPNIRCTGTNDFLEKVQFGSDAMPAFPELTATDIRALATHVQQNFCPLDG